MSKARLSLLVLLFVGTAAALTHFLSQKTTTSKTQQLPSAEELRLKKELEAAVDQNQKLEADNAAMTAKLSDSKAEETAPNHTVAEAPAAQAKGIDFSPGVQQAIRLQLDTKLATLKTRLNLNDFQEKQVRHIYEKEMSQAGEVMKKMFQGKLSKEEAARAKTGNTTEQELKAILNLDQWNAFEKYAAEEHQAQLENMANMELNAIQPILQITDHQQGRIFDVLVNQAASATSPQTTTSETGDLLEISKKQIERKKEALRPILTPEQFGRYEKFLEAQQNMMKAFMPALSGSGK